MARSRILTLQKRQPAKVRVADECWIALALLHRQFPKRVSFSSREILEKLRTQRIHGELRPGVPAHIHQHCVANVEPNSARYRMLYRMPDGTYRLFRPGDDCHPARRGKIVPNRADLPRKYQGLLDWYEQEYGRQRSGGRNRDPVLRMLGLGKEIWAGTNADEFVASLRSGWDESR